MKQFDFGQNWKDFSRSCLNEARIEQARDNFHELMKDVPLSGKTFLDIGFGQGLSLLLAHQAGAMVTGMDINPKCAEVLLANKHVLGVDEPIETLVGSILRDDDLRPLQGRQFDVVHSWGVLHHTGNMYRAIDRACGLVKPGGTLVLALYNRHWSSLCWKWIKWSYCWAPPSCRKVMLSALYPVILAAKFLATGRNPFRMTRGMDFYYNVVDWVGGYPYEYASIEVIRAYLATRGFALSRVNPARVPTGCNEFVFRRSGR